VPPVGDPPPGPGRRRQDARQAQVRGAGGVYLGPSVSASTVSRFHAMAAGRGYGGDILAGRRRQELREFGSWLSDHSELRGCGRKIRKGRVGSSTEILEVTTSCRRKWLCPTCGYTAWRKESAKLTRRLGGWTAQGGAVALLTLTQSHCHKDGLAQLWSRLEAGWAALVRGSGWTADQRAHGVRGYVRITEVVHNPETGWHVHFHVILLLDRALDRSCLDGLRASLAARFARGVHCKGGHAAVGGQDLRPMTPGTEGALANYLFKGTTMRWFLDGSRTPMAILNDLESTGEGLALWDELTTAVSANKRMQVIASTGIDCLCTRAGTTLDK
jgi:Replication protein